MSKILHAPLYDCPGPCHTGPQSHFREWDACEKTTPSMLRILNDITL